jgi:hypothetical protein
MRTVTGCIACRFASEGTPVKFVDPMPITCPQCGVTSSLRVKELLALRAACPACGRALDDVGRGMRERADEMWEYYAWVQVVLEIEDRLNVPTDDPAWEPRGDVLTLAKLANVVRQFLPPGPDPSTRSTALVFQAAQAVCGRAVDVADFDSPIIEVLYRDRWAGR